eukprot:7611014-Pyramimonas_sp.AAC.1
MVLQDPEGQRKAGVLDWGVPGQSQSDAVSGNRSRKHSKDQDKESRRKSCLLYTSPSPRDRSLS